MIIWLDSSQLLLETSHTKINFICREIEDINNYRSRFAIKIGSSLNIERKYFFFKTVMSWLYTVFYTVFREKKNQQFDGLTLILPVRLTRLLLTISSTGEFNPPPPPQ